MRVIFLLLSLQLFVAQGVVWAQANAFTEGTITYERTQDWVKIMAAMPHMSKQAKERAAYNWGNRSEWTRKTALYVKNNASIYRDIKETSESGFTWKEGPFFITRFFGTGLSDDLLELDGKYYRIQDSLQAPAWKIGNDIREVAGHICMNATWEDTLKHQLVSAWFALDIPSPIGPESFFGLPGAILAVDINNGAIRIEAVNLSTDSVDESLFSHPRKLKAKPITAIAFREKTAAYIQYCIQEEQNFAWGMRY
ncbi:MAG: GLPGLI family protein [Saprospiraceae bacterium]